MSLYQEFLKESDCLLKWLADKGNDVKITEDQLEEFTLPFKNPTTDLTTHLFKWGHIESFYGNRIAVTIQGFEFAKKSSYVNEFLKKETNMTHPLFYILEIIFSVVGLF